MGDVLFAALQWDPQIRGFLIVITAVLILIGSVYLLLATNTGARLGLLLTIAGLSGWMMAMGGIWMVFGIGLKGEEPHWQILEVVTGEPEAATEEAMDRFPAGWKKLQPGDKILADAQAAADHILAPTAAAPSEHGGGGGGGQDPEEFDSPFRNATDYVPAAGYELGGENCWLPGGSGLCSPGGAPAGNRSLVEAAIDRLQRGPWHAPHYTVIQVRPVQKAGAGPGEVVAPQPDPSKPLTTVVMLRDLGSLRLPPFLVMLASGVVFALSCYVLHHRDKELWQARTAPAAA